MTTQTLPQPTIDVMEMLHYRIPLMLIIDLAYPKGVRVDDLVALA